VPKPVDFPKLLQLVEEAMHQPLVLVVDDDYELCDSLWELFHDHSYRVCLAYDVSEAVNKLRERSYHVVLVDMKLPTGNGTEVLACLPQANPQARSILITGHRSEMEPLVQKALVNGANAVCYKPFDVELLLDTVSRLCWPRLHAVQHNRQKNGAEKREGRKTRLGQENGGRKMGKV
jgi:DNA-binding NtrC family response regulator